MTLSFFERSDIEENCRRISEIINSNIFSPANSRNPFVKSAFIELLVCMRDLMFKTEKFAARISFDDDVVKTAKVNDVTDLIKFVRDALCHPEIEHHYLIPGSIKATFNICIGKGTLMSIGDITLKSDYDDDVCFFFGAQKIYLTRHIIRAFEEARKKLAPLL